MSGVAGGAADSCALAVAFAPSQVRQEHESAAPSPPSGSQPTPTPTPTPPAAADDDNAAADDAADAAAGGEQSEQSLFDTLDTSSIGAFLSGLGLAHCEGQLEEEIGAESLADLAAAATADLDIDDFRELDSTDDAQQRQLLAALQYVHSNRK